VVAVGQTIKVNYIGKLLDGRVFDTSLITVANDDAAYPKTLSFTKRSNSSYTPLSFEVGAGKMISGFDEAVVGMKVGESKTVTLTPDEAYGEMDPSKLVTFQLTESVPLLRTFTASSFKAEYGVDAAQGLTVSDPLYGWDATVYEFDQQADRVTVKNVPTLNALYHVYGTGSVGWDVMVTGMDSNSDLITIEHQLDEGDSDMIKGLDGTSTFFIIDVDETNGTAVRNYNTELLGKSLVFTITIVSITK
jgi:FKBP-type peptidyl-prolyl cis-trans isomerase 2